VTEEIMLKMGRHVHRETGIKNLCLAGGVALNCVANGRLLREGPFENIWIQPAAGDAGGALGVALFIWHQLLDKPRTAAAIDSQAGSLLGPRFTDDEIRAFLESKGARFRHYADDESLCEAVTDLLVAEKVVGWVQGRMEFGPRALGSRSILGDARSSAMQSVMNVKIKFRESFRPFAPAVLRENVHEWFELDEESPYMLLVADVQSSRRLPARPETESLWGIDKLNVPRSTVPAITHVDYSARVQTVRRESNPLYYDIIKAFQKRTGCPVIVNTSFNVRGEPIVGAPEDAYRCFMRTDMDVLVLENFVLEKSEQTPLVEDESWRKEFVLD
jgi:carbamoyltransferase